PGAPGDPGGFHVTTGGPVGAGQPGPVAIVGSASSTSLAPGAAGIVSVSAAPAPGSLTPGPVGYGVLQAGPIAARATRSAIQPGPSLQPAVVSGVIIGSEPNGAIPIPSSDASAPTFTVLPGPTELSDRLGQELGISGDRVREAMRQTVGTLPQPVDPF